MRSNAVEIVSPRVGFPSQGNESLTREINNKLRTIRRGFAPQEFDPNTDSYYKNGDLRAGRNFSIYDYVMVAVLFGGGAENGPKLFFNGKAVQIINVRHELNTKNQIIRTINIQRQDETAMNLSLRDREVVLRKVVAVENGDGKSELEKDKTLGLFSALLLNALRKEYPPSRHSYIFRNVPGEENATLTRGSKYRVFVLSESRSSPGTPHIILFNGYFDSKQDGQGGPVLVFIKPDGERFEITRINLRPLVFIKLKEN